MSAPIELRFADFEVSLRSGELRRNSIKIKLQEQPFQILVLLLEQRGEVVTREQLRQKLWTADTFVDFDNGLNIAIKKLRTALGDDADASRYIETLPRRGYRFIAPVTAYEFRVEGSGDVFDAILPEATPAPVRVNPGDPQESEEITRKSVEKDRELRDQDASEKRAELKLLKRETEPGRGGTESSLPSFSLSTGTAGSSSTSMPILESRRYKSRVIGMAGLILTIAVAAIFGAYKLLTRNRLAGKYAEHQYSSTYRPWAGRVCHRLTGWKVDCLRQT